MSDSPLAVKGTSHMTQSGTVGKQSLSVMPGDYTALTPESLLLFCQQRLKTMDEAIGLKMAGQKSLVALQSKVSEIQATLKEYNAVGGDNEGAFNDKDKIKAVDEKLDAAITLAQACGDNDLVKILDSVRAKLHGGKDNLVNIGEIKDMTSMLDNALSTCRGSAEVSMIEMQSLISQRGQIIQLTTNMMNVVNESTKAIISNYGRS
jgi:hypothetical protein